MRHAYPDARPGTISQCAGQLYRFVHDAHAGEIVVYREWGGGPINVGVIQGPYAHESGERYGQRRPVKWVDVGLVAADFPPSALYELGASLTWFRIRRHADIWISVVDASMAARP